MLNSIVHFFTGRKIVLFNKHRQTLPLVNENSLRKYIFIDPILIWKSSRVFGRGRMRYRAMALALSFISPVYIIDVNWISKLHFLYYVWCNKFKKAEFVVVQHGTYVGGVITDAAHRYAKCNMMLCWSDYFKNLLAGYNKGKNIRFFVIGNPVYNQYNRSQFNYKTVPGNRVLIATSVMKETRLENLIAFMRLLEKIGFEVTLKEHKYQATMRGYGAIEGFKKITGNLYNMLKAQEYDIVVSDISTGLLDSLFFKNRTLFFSPACEIDFYTKNRFADFMDNLAYDYQQIETREQLMSRIDTDAQEKLLRFLVSEGDNNLKMLTRTLI